MKDLEGNFIRSTHLGETTRDLLSQGFTLDVHLHDRFGNGFLHYSNEDSMFQNIIIPFTEWNVNDDVEISYNNLGTIHRHYMDEVAA